MAAGEPALADDPRPRATRPSAIVAGIEARLRAEGTCITDAPLPRVRLQRRAATRRSARWPTCCFIPSPPPQLVALSLMFSQAFFYNAIFFTYALVLTRFLCCCRRVGGLYIFPFALGNVLGPLLLGPLFDRVGRRRMIAFTYAAVRPAAGAAPAGCSRTDMLSARGQTLAWSVIFFFASLCRKLRLSHRQRDLPTGNSRAGDRGLLCGRHRDRWCRRAGPVWRADRYRLTHEPDGGLSARCRADDFRRRRLCGAGALAAERKPLEQVARPLAFTD